MLVNSSYESLPLISVANFNLFSFIHFYRARIYEIYFYMFIIKFYRNIFFNFLEKSTWIKNGDDKQEKR